MTKEQNVINYYKLCNKLKDVRSSILSNVLNDSNLSASDIIIERNS